jgi:FixJ family two-component response regulator
VLLEPVVAVIDDDEPLRASLVRALRSSGYGVRGFASAEEFVAANGEVSCQCVITDIHMRRMSGLDLKRLLVDRGSQIPVIMISGDPDADLESRAAASGAICLLRKPFRTEALLDWLGEALNA